MLERSQGPSAAEAAMASLAAAMELLRCAKRREWMEKKHQFPFSSKIPPFPTFSTTKSLAKRNVRSILGEYPRLVSGWKHPPSRLPWLVMNKASPSIHFESVNHHVDL
jgi:hypothetical protein